MAEEIVIGKLIIDTNDLESAMVSSKKAIIDLENEQKKLKKDTEGLSTANEDQLKTFVANEAELKRLRSEYSANQKSVLELTKAQTGLDAALKTQVKSQNDAIANTKALTEARKQIDATTVDGAKAIADINAKIDANNKFLNASNSELEKQKANVGNYPQIMGGVGAAFGGATQKVVGFVQGGKDVVGALGAVNNAVVNSAKNVIGFGNASKAAAVEANAMTVSNTGAAVATEGLAVAEETATVATGGLNVALGVLLSPITLIVAAVGLVLFLFKDLDPLLDKIEQGMAAVGAVVDVLTQSILGFVTGASSFMDSFGGMGDAMAKAAEEAAALKEAQQDLADAQKIQEVQNNKATQQYDELILKSKNRTLTEKERVAFLNQAQAIEERNFKQREALAQAELDQALKSAQIKGQLSKQEQERLKKDTVVYATALLNQGKITEKELDAIIKAENGKTEILSESTRRLEKSQNAEDKLLEDAAKAEEARQAKRKAAQDKAQAAEIKNAQNRIDILKAETAQRNLSTEQQIENLEKIFKLQNDLAKKTLSGSDERKQLLANRQELSSAILKLSEEQINKETEAQKKAFSEKAALDQEEFASQIESANLLAKSQILLLDKRLLTEKDFAAEVVKINEAKNETIKVANESFTEAEKVRKEAELTNTRALEEVAHQIRLQDITDRGLTENEIRQATLQENYDNELLLLNQSLADQKVSYEVYTQQKTLADKKFSAETSKNDKAIAAQKKALNNQMLSDGVSALNSLFGENKAVAVASALINTYLGITAALAVPFPASIPAVAAAAATGFAAVKNILSSNKGSTSVDSGSAKPITTSGTGSFVNTAQTETVARVSEKPESNAPIVTPPVLILESLLEAQTQHHIKITSP